MVRFLLKLNSKKRCDWIKCLRYTLGKLVLDCQEVVDLVRFPRGWAQQLSSVSRWKNGHAVCRVELPFCIYQVSCKVAFDRQARGDSHFLSCSSCTLSPVQRHSNLGKQVRRGSHSGLLQAVDRRQSKKKRCLLLLNSSTQVRQTCNHDLFSQP